MKYKNMKRLGRLLNQHIDQIADRPERMRANFAALLGWNTLFVGDAPKVANRDAAVELAEVIGGCFRRLLANGKTAEALTVLDATLQGLRDPAMADEIGWLRYGRDLIDVVVAENRSRLEGDAHPSEDGNSEESQS